MGRGSAVTWWLTHQTPGPEVGGSSPTRVAVFCPWARHINPPNVLVIPRKRWLRTNTTEKMLTGTLSIKPNQKLYNGNERNERQRYYLYRTKYYVTGHCDFCPQPRGHNIRHSVLTYWRFSKVSYSPRPQSSRYLVCATPF